MKHMEMSTNGKASGDGHEAPANPEATIDQVRDLLFGGAQRSIESKLASLQAEMQAAMKQIQADFAKELAAMQAQLLELERDTEQERISSHKEIGTAISELGATISRLGSGRTGK